MSVKISYPPQTDRLINAVSLSDYIEKEIGKSHSPFKPEWFFSPILRICLKKIVFFLEKFFNRTLFVENREKELFIFDKSIRNLLRRLLADGHVSRWECRINNTEYKSHYVCDVTAGNIINEEGKTIFPSGKSYSHGSAETINDALTIALAECIERTVSLNWSEKYLEIHTINDLLKLKRNIFYHSYFTELSNEFCEVPIAWSIARDIQTDKSVLIPTSMLYFGYPMHHKTEPSFLEVSSNGVAAYSNYRQALINALYESFERDGFMMYWLNTLSPQVIDLSSIDSPKHKQTIEELRRRNLDLYLLDCRTEYCIPVIASVLIDNVSGGVYVHAAAGLDIDEVLQKIMDDNQRFNPDYSSPKPEVEEEEIENMYVRMRFWHGGYMKDKIKFFISGSKISYEEYVRQFNLPNGDFDYLEFVKDRLKENGSEVYSYEFPNRLAKEVGLKVVRAVIPDLMPIYFNEKKKHLNVPRLYTFARKMGYKDRDTTKEELNTIPHPFI